MTPRVLFVFTSASKNLLGDPSGWYLPEAAHPYYILAPHAEIDFAAPAGPNPPVDPVSVANYTDAESMKFLTDEVAQAKLATAKKLADCKAEDYDAIFYPGGHGPVLDLAFDPINHKLASDFYQAGKITAAVCHGPAALVGAVDKDGNPILSGKTVSGFTNAEEKAIDAVKTIPFLLEDRLNELGAHMVKADLFVAQISIDGNLLTGQNPASSTPLGEAILKALQQQN